MSRQRSGVIWVSAAFVASSLIVLAISIALGLDAIASLVGAFVITPIVGALIVARSDGAR
jgi:hypothetical protein